MLAERLVEPVEPRPLILVVIVCVVFLFVLPFAGVEARLGELVVSLGGLRVYLLEDLEFLLRQGLCPLQIVLDVLHCRPTGGLAVYIGGCGHHFIDRRQLVIVKQVRDANVHGDIPQPAVSAW